MNCTDAMLYISAFVDRDYSGIPAALRAELETNLRLCPLCATELTMESATKKLIERHAPDTRCPRATFEQIQAFLYHVYRSSAMSSLSM